MINTLILLPIFTISLLPGVTPPNFNMQIVYSPKSIEINKKQKQLYSESYKVLIFYPFDFTFVCPTELWSFSDLIGEFSKLNTEVVGISTDSLFSHNAWLSQEKKDGGLNGLKFGLVSDFSKQISKWFGVLVEDENSDLNGAALRATIIIDSKNVVRHFQINDAGVGRNPSEILRLVQAFQFVDKNGINCPSGWKPGMKGIKPDEEGKKTYFKEL